MKKAVLFYLPITLITALFTSCKVSQNVSEKAIVLKNSSSAALSQKAISIQRGELGKMDAKGVFPILLLKTDTIPAQTNDLNGDGNGTNFFLQLIFCQMRKKISI